MVSARLLYTKCMITAVMELVHRNEVVIKTWKYQMLVWHVTVSAWNDIVIYTYEIHQIHVTIYWVSTYTENDLVGIKTWWSRPIHICMLHVSRLWWYAKFVCYCCYIEITLIGSVWVLFLRISVEFNFNRNLRLIHGTWNLHWNSNLQLGTRTETWTHTYL